MSASRGMRLGIALVALLALFAATAGAIPNPFAADVWQGLADLDSAHGAASLGVFATSPTAPSTIYAGFEGDGVFRSTDDGATWSLLSNGLTGGLALTVRAIMTPGTGPVLAGTAHGLFKLDAGTWSPLAQGAEADPAHPVNLNQSVFSLLAPLGGTTLAGTAGTGVWTSADGGATWAAPAVGNGMPPGTSVLGMVSVASPPPATPIVLAATDNGVYRSSDLGATWTPKSDGIPVTTVQMVSADANNPDILYAGTLGHGVYRSLNSGESWGAVNGSGAHALGGDLEVQAMVQFPSAPAAQKTRLYVGTPDGVWAGETGSGPHPGAIAWRRITDAGLHQANPPTDNVNVRALSGFLTDFPDTLLGGTQTNGGYALRMTQPSGSPPGVTSSGTIADLHANDTLTATAVGWTGTPNVEVTWQWQRCTSAGASCEDIEGATDAIYHLVDDDVGHKVQVVSTGRNEFPSFTDNAVARTTQLMDIVGAAVHPELEPGASVTPPSTPTSSNADAPITQIGDTLTANGWAFNPAASSRRFRWYRCVDPTSAQPADGTDGCSMAATTDTTAYVTTPDDLEQYMCVVVIGTNQFGTASTPCSARTLNVVAPDPVLAPGSSPTVVGPPHVGDTVTGSIGEYTFSPVRVAQRLWHVCDGQGNNCAAAPPATIDSPTYPVAAADLGSTLRFEVLIDTNGSSEPPTALSFMSPPSAVVTAAPPPPPPAFPIDPTSTPTPTPTPDPGAGDGGTVPTPTLTPMPDASPSPDEPKLLAASLVKKRVKRGRLVRLTYQLEDAVSLTIQIQKRSTGHKARAGCRKGKPTPRQHRCTVTKTVGRFTLATPEPSGTVSFKASAAGRKLKPGTYNLVVAPLGPSGTDGPPKTLRLKVTDP